MKTEITAERNYILLVDYISGITDMKCFVSYREADRYLKVILRYKFCEIAHTEISYKKIKGGEIHV